MKKKSIEFESSSSFKFLNRVELELNPVSTRLHL